MGAAALARRNHTRICDLAAPTEIQTGELGATALTKRNNNLPCSALFLYPSLRAHVKRFLKQLFVLLDNPAA